MEADAWAAGDAYPSSNVPDLFRFHFTRANQTHPSLTRVESVILHAGPARVFSQILPAFGTAYVGPNR